MKKRLNAGMVYQSIVGAGKFLPTSLQIIKSFINQSFCGLFAEVANHYQNHILRSIPFVIKLFNLRPAGFFKNIFSADSKTLRQQSPCKGKRGTGFIRTER